MFCQELAVVYTVSSILFADQICFGTGIVSVKCSNDRAGFHLATIAASGNAFFQCTLANGAEAVAEDGLLPVEAASFAVDMFWQYGNIVQLRPQPGGFLTQCLVVVLGGDVCVAFLAVQSAISNQLFHFLLTFKL